MPAPIFLAAFALFMRRVLDEKRDNGSKYVPAILRRNLRKMLKKVGLMK